jgi:hypothetical protein
MPSLTVRTRRLQTRLLVRNLVLPLPLSLPLRTAVVKAEEFDFAVCRLGFIFTCSWIWQVDCGGGGRCRNSQS